MSLDVDWSMITPPITKDEKEKVAFSVGMALLVCGMREIISHKDVQEIYLRCALYERLTLQPIAQSSDLIDMSRVTFWSRWRGVSINGTFETRRAWFRRIADGVCQQIIYDLHKERRDAVHA